MKIYNVYLSYYVELRRLRFVSTDRQQNTRSISADPAKQGANLVLIGICTWAGNSLIKGPFACFFFLFVLQRVGILRADGKDDRSIVARSMFLSRILFQATHRVASTNPTKSSQPERRNNFTPLLFSFSFCILADTCNVLISQNLACNTMCEKETYVLLSDYNVSLH